jgi:hypothetical protein
MDLSRTESASASVLTPPKRTPTPHGRKPARGSGTLRAVAAFSTPTARTPEDVAAIVARSREVLGRVSPTAGEGGSSAEESSPTGSAGVASSESFGGEASAALSELSGEVLGLSAVIVRQQEEAGFMKNRQQRTEDALRAAEERMQALELQCAGISDKMAVQALQAARERTPGSPSSPTRLSPPPPQPPPQQQPPPPPPPPQQQQPQRASSRSPPPIPAAAVPPMATPPLPAARSRNPRHVHVSATAPPEPETAGAAARSLQPRALAHPEPEPEPEPEPVSAIRDINPRSASQSSPESDVWVTPAGIVEAIEEGGGHEEGTPGPAGGGRGRGQNAAAAAAIDADESDGSGAAGGEFQFGAPFEYVRHQAAQQGEAQGRVEAGVRGDSDSEEEVEEDEEGADSVNLEDYEHERKIWEHFLLLRQDSQSRVLHGLFGVTHPPHYPRGIHDVYGSSGSSGGGCRGRSPAGLGSRAGGTASAVGQQARARYTPPSPGQLGYSNALMAGAVTAATATAAADVYDESRGDGGGGGADLLGSVSPRSASIPSIVTPSVRSSLSPPHQQPQHHTPPVQRQQQQQQHAAAADSDDYALIGRALIAGNCLLDGLN